MGQSTISFLCWSLTLLFIWHWDQRVNQHLEYCRLRKLEGYIKPFPMVFTHTIINVTFRGDALNNAIVAPTRPQLVPFEWGEPAKMWNLKKTLEHDEANEASTIGAFQDNVLLRLRRWAIKRWHVRSNTEELWNSTTMYRMVWSYKTFQSGRRWCKVISRTSASVWSCVSTLGQSRAFKASFHVQDPPIHLFLLLQLFDMSHKVLHSKLNHLLQIPHIFPIHCSIYSI